MRSRASRVKQADTGSPGAFSAPVRKKRGRRAPPSSRCLRGKKDDNVMSSDDAITEEDDAASPSSRKAKQQNHGEIAVGSSAGPTGQSVSVNEAHENSRALKNTSNVQTTAVKKTTAEDKTSRAIMDDVFNAEIDSTSSDDESTEEVEDVKVCDICGDVGDEVKLAVCNRCNDGAEHTYCMRVMMEKVPDGEWFCEECQTEVELEKEKLEKPQVKLVTSKEESVEGKISKPFNDANSRSPCENEVEDETVGRKERNEANQGIDMVEDAKILPVAKQNIPEPGGLSMESYSRKGIPLPRESSFRLDKEKGKQPTSQVPILLGSNASKNQAPPLTGQLSKSTSFNNSKVPKVKQLVNEVPQKTKTWKEQLSCSMRKEGPTSFSTKSASFKKPKTCEPANKAKSSIIPPAEELSAMNLPVSRNVSNDRGTSILGCPSITGPLAFPVQSRAESAAQRLTTGNNISASSNSGHFTQFCGVDKLGLSAMKPLSERNLKDASAKRNKMSEATEKVTSRSAGQSDHILKCGPYHDPDQDLRSSSSTSMRTASTDYSSLKFKDCRAVSAVTGRSVPSSSTISSDPIDKSSRGFSPVDKTIVSTVPELDYIWQGDFELWRTGRSPELCDGFQAHLSCSASPKVLEVAKKFPSRVQLEELPRRNSWPTQFQQNGPTYENIGVFFFARDAQSYEHHYSKLVQNMLINDLALRGNIETAELIIFPSNILSKNSQRWNMFYFLWGVFKVKREDHWNLPLDVPISKCEPNLNEDPLTVDPHTSVLSSSRSLSEDQNNGTDPACYLVKSATSADHQCLQTSEANLQGCSNGDNSSVQAVAGRDLKDHCHDSSTTCFTNNRRAIDDFSTAPAGKHKIIAYPDSQKKMCDGGNVVEPIFDVNTMPVTCSISSIHKQDNQNRAINLNNAESLMDVDHANNIELNSGTVDLVSHASRSAQKRNVDMANWIDGANGSVDKKIKLDNVSSTVESSLSGTIRDGRLSSKVHPLAALPVHDCTDNKTMAGISKSNGKCTFPLDLNVVDDADINSVDDAATGNSMTVQSEDLPEQNTQDLKPALGDNTSSRKPMVEEKWNKGDPPPTDMSGALSLSLAFPASKEQ
uniref:PHD-type domain-containing protein n=1 Tax=Hordeum vulgare subsp. vulgare TaxID=112509 RepID=A0A8I6YKZ5_HORVV